MFSRQKQFVDGERNSVWNDRAVQPMRLTLRDRLKEACADEFHADAIDALLGGTEFILDGGNAAGHSGHVVQQGLSLPVVKKVVEREVEKRDSKIEDALSDI